MKNRNLRKKSLPYFILLILFNSFWLSCDHDDDYNPNLDPDPNAYWDNIICKNWDVISFLEDSIERFPDLESDSCYMPIEFDCDDHSYIFGTEMTLNCNIHGSFGFSLDHDSLLIAWGFGSMVGIGPWSSNVDNWWRILEFQETLIKLESDYGNKNYVVTLKPL